MTRCKGVTLKGTRCKRLVKNGEYCPCHVVEVNEVEKVNEVNEVEKVNEVDETEEIWPSLEEVHDEIKIFCISTLGGIHSYAKAKNTLNLSKQGQRLVALTISDSILQVPIPEDAKLSVKLLLITVIRKLTESKYNIE